MTSVVFMGTPEAAVPSLEALTRIADVSLVVTRPDRPRGRSRRLQAPPIKEAAEQLGLAVAQPENSTALAECVVGRVFDVGVVVAFGMILRAELLAMPERGFLNVHFSLLPRWRGAAPVERALMAGDTESGITIMAMDEGLDTGPIVAQAATAVGPEETGGSLRTRLASMGADLLVEVLPGWVAGDIVAESQPQAASTYAARLEANDRLLETSMTTEEVSNRVRALAPDPGALLQIEGVSHKILEVAASARHLSAGAWEEVDGRPVIGFSDRALEILTIQPAGKKPMSGEAWLRGRRLPAG